MFNLRNLFLATIRGQHYSALDRVKKRFKPVRAKHTKYTPHQGRRGIARRSLQILNGTLHTN